MTTEHTGPRMRESRVMNCTFRGYNLDGSEPIQYTRNDAGQIIIVDFIMDGWTCYGPTITQEVGKSELDVLHKLAETYASDLVDERTDKLTAEDLMKLAQEYAVRYRVNHAVDEARKALMDALQSQAERIKAQDSEIERIGKLLSDAAAKHCADYPNISECPPWEKLYALVTTIEGVMLANEDMHEANKTLRAQLAALQSDDELPEPAVYQAKTKPGFISTHPFAWEDCEKKDFLTYEADGVHVRKLFTADQLRQAQSMVRAKMVPLEKDAERYGHLMAYHVHQIAPMFGVSFGSYTPALETITKVSAAIDTARGITGVPK